MGAALSVWTHEHRGVSGRNKTLNDRPGSGWEIVPSLARLACPYILLGSYGALSHTAPFRIRSGQALRAGFRSSLLRHGFRLFGRLRAAPWAAFLRRFAAEQRPRWSTFRAAILWSSSSKPFAATCLAEIRRRQFASGAAALSGGLRPQKNPRSSAWDNRWRGGR